ncbi:MAG TPA: hypothetical protein VFV30_11610, partial [Novosphingobium sp.]|nr:hypothetical protein [Novosphingobium sp.]
KPANALDGRELECVAALLLFETFLAEQIKNKGPTTPEGLDYTRAAKTNAAALGWYLGRVSSMPADRVGKSAFVEANAKVRGMEAKKALVFIQDCTQNYQENAGEAFGAWLG